MRSLDEELIVDVAGTDQQAENQDNKEGSHPTATRCAFLRARRSLARRRERIPVASRRFCALRCTALTRRRNRTRERKQPAPVHRLPLLKCASPRAAPKRAPRPQHRRTVTHRFLQRASRRVLRCMLPVARHRNRPLLTGMNLAARTVARWRRTMRALLHLARG